MFIRLMLLFFILTCVFALFGNHKITDNAGVTVVSFPENGQASAVEHTHNTDGTTKRKIPEYEVQGNWPR